MKNLLRLWAALLVGAALLIARPASAAPAPTAVLYGPVRLRESLAHPEGYYTGLGFTGLVAILDLPQFPQQLLALHNHEPGLELYPEIALSGKPATWDQAAWDAYWQTLQPALAAAKSVGASTLVLNGENESAPSQRAFWATGKGDDPKARGKELGKRIRAAGFLVALDVLPEYEDPKVWEGGSKNCAFVPFVRGLAPDLLLNGDSSGGKDAKSSAKAAAKALNCATSALEVWLTRQRFEAGQEASWDSFVSALAEARANGVACVTPENDGDVFPLLTVAQIERVRGVLK